MVRNRSPIIMLTLPPATRSNEFDPTLDLNQICRKYSYVLSRPAERFDTIRSCTNNTTSARCFSTNLLEGFLGLGGTAAFALLSSSLQLPDVFKPPLRDMLPTLPSKLDAGGILFFRQNSEGLALFSSRYYA